MKRWNNKRGWIRVVEAVIALLLVMGVLLFVINKGYFRSEGSISSKVYGDQITILRGIELDQDLRLEILSSNWGNSGINQTSWNELPMDIQNKILSTTPAYLNCTAKLCELNKICTLTNEETPLVKNIYSQAVAIVAEQNIYKPRQLKLFCWNR
jgi:hypothetical protein